MDDTYKVQSQTPVKAALPDGTIGDAVEIRFTTKPSNQQGVVRIPRAMYTPDEVDRVLRAETATIETIQGK